MASRVKRLVLWLLAAVVAFGGLANAWVWSAGWGRFHADPAELPAGSIVVLLGTNELLADQRTPSGTYRARIEATVRLCAGGRPRLVVASGTPEQAATMARQLVAAGVRTPIVEDPYGWRTLDSAVRAHAAYPGAHVVFVSQGWHCVRALWLADHASLRATAYPASFGDGWRPLMGSLRDCFAKPKAVIDLCRGNPLTAPVSANEGNVPHR